MGHSHHTGGVAGQELYPEILTETVVLLMGFLYTPGDNKNWVKKDIVWQKTKCNWLYLHTYLIEA